MSAHAVMRRPSPLVVMKGRAPLVARLLAVIGMTGVVDLVAVVGAAGVAAAAPAMPDPQRLHDAMQSAPEVVAARARLAEAQNEARLLSIGPYEWTVSGSGGRRSIDEEGRFGEWDAGLERPVRLPGKARLDRQIGDLTVKQARAALAVAQRESAAAIRAAWFDCVRADQRARIVARERGDVDTMARALERRHATGDISRQELALARAELAGVVAESGTASAAAVTAARLLATRLADVSCRLDAMPQPDAPPPRGSETGALADADPGVATRRAAAAIASRAAERARQDQLPDPTLGMHYGAERSGAERIGTITLSVPLGVRRRTAEAARAAAAADAATAELDVARREAGRRWVAIESTRAQTWTSWRSLADAAREAEIAADLAHRGFELGETSLSDALLARRMAVRARLAELDAAIDAHAAAADYEAYVQSARSTSDL